MSIHNSVFLFSKAMGKRIFVDPTPPLPPPRKTIKFVRVLTGDEAERKKRLVLEADERRKRAQQQKQAVIQKLKSSPKPRLAQKPSPSKKECKPSHNLWFSQKQKKKAGEQKTVKSKQTKFIYHPAPPLRTREAKAIAEKFLGKMIKLASKKGAKVVGKVMKVDDSFVSIQRTGNLTSSLEPVKGFCEKYEAL